MVKRINKLLALIHPRFIKYTLLRLKRQRETKHKNRSEITTSLNKKMCQFFFKYFDRIKEPNMEIKGIEAEPIIFVYWHDGADNLPELVKLCYDRLLSITNKKVVLLSKENISSYVSIDSDILERVNNKTITLTLFSDILRAKLLATYNCIWLDATCYLLRDIPDYFLNEEIVTVYPGKNKNVLDNIERFNFVARLQIQQTYFLIGRNKKIFTYWYYYLCEYIKNEGKYQEYNRPYYISYFIFEYLYNKYEFVKEACDKRIVNNSLCERIEGYNTNAYEPKDINMYFNDNTFLYKLNSKIELRKEIDGKITPFGKLLEKGSD